MITDPELERLKDNVRARVKRFREAIKNIPNRCEYSVNDRYQEDDEPVIKTCHGCKEHAWYATCPEYATLARVIPAGEPYQMSGKEYKIGKSWVENYDDNAIITVVEIFYVPVDKIKLDRYVNLLIDRLKNREGKKMSDFEKERMLFRIDDLEDLRRELHGHISANAGFEPMETSKEAVAFKYALEAYVEQQAQKFGAF